MQANVVLDGRPGIERIDQGSLLRILQLSTSLLCLRRTEDIQNGRPRGYLGLVSRSLNRFILNEPSLWTTLVIHPDSPVETYTLDSAPTSNYLTRSGDLPLAIYLLPGTLVDGADRRMEREGAAARLLGELIAKEAARITRLVVRTRWRSSLVRIGNLLDPRYLPAVEQLVIESSIDDVGAPDVGLPIHLDDPTSLTSLSIDAVNLLAFLASTHNPHDVLALITSLTVTNIYPGTYGFPEDDLSSIIELINSILYLQSLTFDDFQMLERHLETFGIVHRHPRTPTQLNNLTLRNTSGSAPLTTSIQRALINCHCPIELNCNNCTNTDLELEYLRRQNRVTGLKDTELGLTLRQILFYLPPCRLSLSTTHRPTATATSPIQSLPPSPPTFLPPPAPPPHESHVSAERSPTTANNHGSSPSHPPPLAGTIHCIATAQPNEREGLLESDTDVERVSTHWNFGRGRKRASRSSGSISLGSEGWRLGWGIWGGYSSGGKQLDVDDGAEKEETRDTFLAFRLASVIAQLSHSAPPTPQIDLETLSTSSKKLKSKSKKPSSSASKDTRDKLERERLHLERLKQQGVLPEDAGGEEFKGFQGSGSAARLLRSDVVQSASAKDEEDAVDLDGGMYAGSGRRTYAAKRASHIQGRGIILSDEQNLPKLALSGCTPEPHRVWRRGEGNQLAGRRRVRARGHADGETKGQEVRVKVVEGDDKLYNIAVASPISASFADSPVIHVEPVLGFFDAEHILPPANALEKPPRRERASSRAGGSNVGSSGLGDTERIKGFPSTG
ncbi:hypothetical protein D9611_008431 [Ephemerocybe angulata]|uniref:Uncharacterized protein n=1 Tax=Ephemerocybe angulata TaxID=980116 RepID=A0A8H5BJ87_9AGAR|nr:hypothetical protein D9611_008431 [Tulosesus angulatus]